MDTARRLEAVRTSLWALTCGSLFLAAASKATEFALFARYVSLVTGVSGPWARVLAACVVIVEVAIPLISLTPRFRAPAAVSASALFASFAAFHLARATAGDPLPCACFGKLLSLSPAAFSVICAGLAASSFLTARSLGLSPGWTRLPAAARVLWVGSALCLLGAEGKFVYGAAMPPAVEGVAAVALSPEKLVGGAARIVDWVATEDAIVVFGDYQCPFCRDLYGSIRSMGERGPDIYWRDLPLEGIHPAARAMAVVGRVAAGRSEFKPAQGRLFGMGGAIPPDVNAIGKEVLGSSPSRSEAEAARLAVLGDLALSRELKLTGTPALFAIHRGRVFRVATIEAATKLFSTAAES